MKIIRNVLFSAFLIVLVWGYTVSAGEATYPNYAKSSEWWNQLGFTGYVQVLPAYNDSGYGGLHVKQGYFKYYNTQDTSTYGTDEPKGAYDNTIYKKEKGVWDIFSVNAPKAVFKSWFKLF